MKKNLIFILLFIIIFCFSPNALNASPSVIEAIEFQSSQNFPVGENNDPRKIASAVINFILFLLIAIDLVVILYLSFKITLNKIENKETKEFSYLIAAILVLIILFVTFGLQFFCMGCGPNSLAN